ncbi:MAG: hypothetical protein KBD63_06220, partial [Bacteriovoracaceae bacterium]|nr:hypothetical protein [Bacteriovoracaceae bacterium]
YDPVANTTSLVTGTYELNYYNSTNQGSALISHNGLVYFQGWDGSNSATEGIWSYNIVTGALTFLFDENDIAINLSRLINGKIYFIGYQNVTVYDPALPISVSNPQSNNLTMYMYKSTVIDDKIYLSVENNLISDYGFAILDPTQAIGASNPLYVDPNSAGGCCGAEDFVKAGNGKIYMAGPTTATSPDTELLEYNPLNSTITQMTGADLTPTLGDSSSPYVFGAAGNNLWLTLHNGTSRQLYVLDISNPSNTPTAIDLCTGCTEYINNEGPNDAQVIGTDLYLTASAGVSPNHGIRLVKIDMTAPTGNPTPIEVTATNFAPFPGCFENIGNKLYFASETDTSPNNIAFIYDPASPVVLGTNPKPISAETVDSYPCDFVSVLY